MYMTMKLSNLIRKTDYRRASEFFHDRTVLELLFYILNNLTALNVACHYVRRAILIDIDRCLYIRN